MSLTATEIARVLVEIEPDCANQRLSDAKTLAREPGLVLEFGRAEIVVATASEFARICRVPRRPATRPADTFCMAVRKRFEGRRLASLVQVGGDRVVRLDFGDAGAIVVELFGQRGGIFIVDARGVITHTAVTRHAARIGTPWSLVERPLANDPPTRFRDPISHAIADAYEPRVEAAALARAKRDASAHLHVERTRAEKKRAKLASELARADDAPKLRRDAGLLLAHLTTLPPGATRAVVTDVFDAAGATTEIAIDPRLGPKGTAERAFKLARRLDRSRAIIAAEIARCDAAITRLLAAESAIAAVPSFGALAALGLAVETPAVKPRRARTPTGEAADKKPYKSYTSSDGFEIRVGRGAKENDALTFRHANGNDLWMHARDYPGSHVVVPVQRGAGPSEATIREAALLAAHFSGAKGEKVVDVTLAARKHVSKPRGAKPGLVSVARARTITVRVDPKAIRQLVERPREP